MSRIAFLVDIGSTFTKGVAVSLDGPEILGRARVATTTEQQEGVGRGFEEVRAGLLDRAGAVAFDLTLASSSAHGGLRVIALGLMPELTAKAAKMACLNAGARLLACYSHRLGDEDLAEIDGKKPDVLLLAGGTDGGDTGCVVHNARSLCRLRHAPVILYAGNCEAADDVRSICAGRDVFFTENVLPELDTLNIGPAREKMREIFLSRIVSAKGLDTVTGRVDGSIVPTPLAVLNALSLLSQGTDSSAGRGELMAVDVGGATTDVCSACSGAPAAANTVLKGVPEPYFKRTVEGDIGMRSSLQGLVATEGEDLSTEAPSMWDWIGQADSRAGRLPESEEAFACDAVLAARAGAVAIERHCGRLTEHYSPAGRVFIQEGKDMRGISTIIATGGVFACNSEAAARLERNLKGGSMHVLGPSSPQIVPDSDYILYAAGLLASRAPDAALSLMHGSLINDGA